MTLRLVAQGKTINEPDAHQFRIHPPTEVELVHAHANFRLL
jgi:hypothetical protein